MEHDYVFIPTNGETQQLYTKSGKLHFKDLYPVIGCQTIELLRSTDGTALMLIDEEGKLVSQPEVNISATFIAQTFGMISYNDVICGNAILCADSMID